MSKQTLVPEKLLSVKGPLHVENTQKLLIFYP